MRLGASDFFVLIRSYVLGRLHKVVMQSELSVYADRCLSATHPETNVAEMPQAFNSLPRNQRQVSYPPIGAPIRELV